MVTPVPIPNTEVKHFRGENSYACHSERSSLPGSLVPFLREPFFVSRWIDPEGGKEAVCFVEEIRKRWNGFLCILNQGFIK
mgnify:CR=1 FL=1